VGILGRVVSFVRAVVDGAQAPEVAIDLDGDEALTALHFGPPGIDAAPLPGDEASLQPGSGTGALDAVGYQDPSTPGQARPGEVRLYARSGPGVVAVELWLTADGTLVARNASGAELALGPDGAVRAGNELGELAVDAAGLGTWRTPLGQNGAGTHAHATPFGPTSGPIPGT
jgi:hypothetical protein